VVELRRNHERPGPVYASTAWNSLRFSDLDRGLHMAAALAKSDADSQQAVKDVKEGRLAGLSVGMGVSGDDWGKCADGRTELRTVTAATLFETSLVTRSANPGATIESVRREYRSEDPMLEYRSVPLAFRQMSMTQPDMTDDDGDQDGDELLQCPVCGYRGPEANFTQDGDEDDGRAMAFAEGIAESRRDFTDKEKAQHGKQGMAVYVDGHWAFPTPTRQDYDNAVKALGRTPGKNRAKVRRYLMKRARQEGWPIPDSWQSDGSIKRGEVLPFALRAEYIDVFALEAGLPVSHR
jgi:HK97 family phage prohead protease